MPPVLKGRPEYEGVAWNGNWSTYCAKVDLAENRFDEMVPQMGVPKRDLLSHHAYGCALDINATENAFGSHQAFDLPIELVRLLEGVGFYWGGRYHNYMHFEWVDERLPAVRRSEACRM